MEDIVFGFVQIFEIKNILMMLIGTGIGIIIGAIPGLGTVLAISLMLPITFGMDAATGMLLLIGIYCGGCYGGSIPAILINTPGTAASVATSADGFPLAKQGKASTVLNTALYASVAGGLISGFVLLLFAPPIAKVALKFGPPEYFMLAIFGLSVISSVSGKSLSKGLVMGCVGMLISTIGLDPVSGVYRFTFNTTFLTGGVELIAVLIGLFAIAEALNQVLRGSKSIVGNLTFKKEKFSLKKMSPFKKTILKSSFIGTCIGAIPGTGQAIAAFVSYAEARRSSKDPNSYGKGNLDGVVASETANNGTTGATLIPTMTLGIPGDVDTAILIGALIMQGLTPGPELFTKNGDFAYTIIIGFLFINVIMFLQGKLAIRWFARITTVPSSILLPIVLILCLVGTYAINHSMHSVVIAILFGFLGYFLIRNGYPVAPLLIAMILGPMAERSLLQSLTLSSGSFIIFLQRPIALLFLILTILSMFIPVFQKWLRERGVA